MENAKILNNLEEIAFFNDKGILDNFYLDKEQKSLLQYIYNESKKSDYGFSEQVGLRMLKINKYLMMAGIDYIIRPIILFQDAKGDVFEVEDHQHEDILGSSNKITPYHKILANVSYTHVLPTGKIIEHLFQPFVNPKAIDHIYDETKAFRKSFVMSEELNKELSQEENNSIKRIKI